MMTWRMGGSVCTVLRRGRGAGLFFAFALMAGAASGGDNAAYVSYSGVPSAMHPSDTATVTVTMRNTGTTTWQTSVATETDDSTQTTTRTTYSLDAVGHGWGVNGVVVSGSVAPNATRSFQFTITAPETATKRNYVFRWQMARSTVVTERPIHARSPVTFGAATPSRTIQVGPDMAPSFGSATIPGQSWVKDSRITPVTLPGATGGNGTLSYALTCSLPPGVSFASATKRISGTPRRLWPETTCTWKVTDADDNTAASDADTLTFTIEVAPPDTAPEFNETVNDLVLIEGQAMSAVLTDASGGNGALHYSLSPRPAGLTFDDSTRTLSGTPTSTQNPRTYTYKVTDSDANTAASDADTLTFTITVEPDTAPVFNGPVNDLVLIEGQAMSAVLTDASGGNGALHYSLSPPPAGLTFNSSTRTLSGRPTRTQNAKTYTYKVTDSDANTAPSDADTLTFTITVEPDTAPVFKGPVGDQEWVQNTAIPPVTLPEAMGGNGPLTYLLTCSLPPGVAYNASRKRISGTPTTAWGPTTCTWSVTDSDGNTSPSDSDTETFTITVEPDTAPVFKGPVGDQEWVQNTAIPPVTLPEAMGGNGPLTYLLTCSLPPCVAYNASRKRISGTPSTAWGGRRHAHGV